MRGKRHRSAKLLLPSIAVVAFTLTACDLTSSRTGATPSQSASATPSETASPTPSPTPDTVDGSASTFDLNLSFSGAIQGDMARAHSTKGLCDSSASRIDVILDGQVGSRLVNVQILVDRVPGPIRGIFVVIPSDQTSGIGSMSAAYIIGADRVSGSVESSLASGGVGTPAGHASGSWQCHN
jgi:hypothetical protein